MVSTPRVHHDNSSQAMSLEGVGDKFLGQLRDGMAFQGLQVGRLERTLPNGAKIICNIRHGIETVDISVPQADAKSNKWLRECFCSCDFVVGVVMARRGSLTGNDPETPLYDVIACSGDSYAFYENVLASDFSKYVDGQTVIMMPYCESDFSCCGIESNGGCAPKVSDHDRDDESWRTTFRILPWCADQVGLWMRDERL